MIHVVPQGDAFILTVFCPACLRLVSRENGVCMYQKDGIGKPTEMVFIHKDCRIHLTDQAGKYEFFTIDIFFSAIQDALNPEVVARVDKMIRLDPSESPGEQ